MKPANSRHLDKSAWTNSELVDFFLDAVCCSNVKCRAVDEAAHAAGDEDDPDLIGTVVRRDMFPF